MTDHLTKSKMVEHAQIMSDYYKKLIKEAVPENLAFELTKEYQRGRMGLIFNERTFDKSCV